MRGVDSFIRRKASNILYVLIQECREACGGQGLKTENRVGHLKSEFDVQSTFEGDNNVLMQQVLVDYDVNNDETSKCEKHLAITLWHIHEIKNP